MLQHFRHINRKQFGGGMISSMSAFKQKMPMSFGFYNNILKDKVAKNIDKSVQACADADERPFINSFFT